MNIKEVLKEENIDKEYKFGERIYKVVKSFNEILTLKNVETHEYIEFEMHLFSIINGEFKEIVDWAKVPVDTKILVSDDGEDWIRRYFAKYENGRVYAFMEGTTSFTVYNEGVCDWDYAKLYEEQE